MAKAGKKFEDNGRRTDFYAAKRIAAKTNGKTLGRRALQSGGY
jgi:hypothetical protein